MAEKDRFEMILSEENSKIFNYLLKILRNKEDAEDILQDVYIAFYRKMETINPNAYKSYLFKTAYHKALNYIRKDKKKTKLMFNDENMDIYKEENQEEKPDYNSLIKNALQKLPIKYSTLLELQYYQKKSYKEIAEIMDMSVSAVDSKLVRAKKKLKKIISQDSKKNRSYKLK